ncbi:exonuclease domain-containing protein [Enterocloster citroniae]
MEISNSIDRNEAVEMQSEEGQRYRKIRQKGKNVLAFPDTYCLIDIETTGLSPDYDSIIEVSGIIFEGGKEKERFSSLLKPDSMYDDGTYIDDFIMELTGITNEMLSEAPDTKSVLMEFHNFIGNSAIIGHNVNFDINFLYDNFEKYLSVMLTNDYVDTMRISRLFHPEEPHHRLKDLARKYKIDYSAAHRSLGDCLITQKCYETLKQEISETYGGLDSFIEAYQKRGQTRAGDIVSNKTDFDTSHPLYGKVCVFTGTLEKMSRKEAMQTVVDFGGINGDSVTKKTNYLILGNNDYCPLIKGGKSNKQKKAEKLKLDGFDIETIPESVFYDML